MEYTKDQIRAALTAILDGNEWTMSPGGEGSSAARIVIRNGGNFRISSTLGVEESDGRFLTITGEAKALESKLREYFSIRAAESAQQVTIDVRADYLKALAAFTAPQDIRYYLAGIHVRPHHEKGVILEASDGHSAGIIHDESGACNKPAILKIDADMLKKVKAGDRYNVENGRGCLLRRGEEIFVMPGVSAPLIDEKFPDIPKMMDGKKFAPGLTECVNFEYIDRCKLKALRLQYGTALKFWHQVIEDDPAFSAGVIVVRNESAPEFMGLVMPMRSDVSEPVPGWFAQRAGAE